ncbi:MAG: hypothetical protein HWN65_22750 [Candidatus Helarchaeota archaeon]|nr:hypothetical protein [Candidatus Helarchaeota archaeon]
MEKGEKIRIYVALPFIFTFLGWILAVTFTGPPYPSFWFTFGIYFIIACAIPTIFSLYTGLDKIVMYENSKEGLVLGSGEICIDD